MPIFCLKYFLIKFSIGNRSENNLKNQVEKLEKEILTLKNQVVDLQNKAENNHLNQSNLQTLGMTCKIQLRLVTVLYLTFIWKSFSSYSY